MLPNKNVAKNNSKTTVQNEVNKQWNNLPVDLRRAIKLAVCHTLNYTSKSGKPSVKKVDNSSNVINFPIKNVTSNKSNREVILESIQKLYLQNNSMPVSLTALLNEAGRHGINRSTAVKIIWRFVNRLWERPFHGHYIPKFSTQHVSTGVSAKKSKHYSFAKNAMLEGLKRLYQQYQQPISRHMWFLAVKNQVKKGTFNTGISFCNNVLWKNVMRGHYVPV